MRNYITDNFLIVEELDSTDAALRLGTLDLMARMTSKNNDYAKIAKRIPKIDLDSVRAVAEKYLDLDKSMSAFLMSKK